MTETILRPKPDPEPFEVGYIGKAYSRPINRGIALCDHKQNGLGFPQELQDLLEPNAMYEIEFKARLIE